MKHLLVNDPFPDLQKQKQKKMKIILYHKINNAKILSQIYHTYIRMIYSILLASDWLNSQILIFISTIIAILFINF